MFVDGVRKQSRFSVMSNSQMNILLLMIVNNIYVYVYKCK